ncbi:MAG: hypothetical protein ACRD3F_07820 [Acidobacteriaceae bacterium]
MKTHFVRPTFLGVSAMLIATCGYAGAQVAPSGAQVAPSTQPETSQTMRQSSTENVQLVSADAQLTHKIDSKTATQGQKVKAKLTSDVKAANGMKLDKGTMLLGTVAKVERSNGNGPSQISLVFDQARLKDGRTIPVKATLLGAYPSNAGDYFAETGTNGNLMPGEPHRISAQEKIDQMPGTLSHVGMHSAVQSNVSATFISKDRDIDLRKGTRLQVAIAPLAGATGMAG